MVEDAEGSVGIAVRYSGTRLDRSIQPDGRRPVSHTSTSADDSVEVGHSLLSM